MSDESIESVVILADGSRVRYRDVPDHPGYRVGTDGSVWSCRLNNGRLGERWRQLIPQCIGLALPGGRRYLGVRLYPDKTYTKVHRLVLLAFVGDCPVDRVCCHKDGDPSNNRLDNLRWDTPVSNHADSVRHGYRPVGPYKRRPRASKFTAAQIEAIRELRATGLSHRRIGQRLGIPTASVRNIIRRNHFPNY